MFEFLQENQLLLDINFTDFRRTDEKNKLLKWCCGGLFRQTSLVLWGTFQTNFIEAYLFPWTRWCKVSASFKSAGSSGSL